MDTFLIVYLCALYVLAALIAWPILTRRIYDWGSDAESGDWIEYLIPTLAGLIGAVLWPVVIVVRVAVPVGRAYLFGDR